MSTVFSDIPIIAIDGPSASGKGAVAQEVAKILGFHYLDSGALYRVVAFAARQAHIDLTDEAKLAQLIENDLVLRFDEGEIWLNGEKITELLRSEQCSQDASIVAQFPSVRAALLNRQRAFRKAPGLVAEGRDMGSIVFPDAKIKLFLTASAEQRATRRYKQLIEKGIDVIFSDILLDINRRDARDSARAIAPLQKCSDAILLDTTDLTLAEAVARVVSSYRNYSL